MANKQINEFATATKPFADTDIIHAKQGVSDRKMSIGDIIGEVGSISNYAACSGTVNSYIITPAGKTKPPSSYFDGLEITFKPNITNTAGSTINYASLGARNVFNNGSPLAAGDFVVGEDVVVIYNSTDNRFDIKLGSARYVDTSSAQEVDGQKTFLQTVEGPRIVSNTGEFSSNATLIGDAEFQLRDDSGALRGIVRWDRAANTLTITRFDSTGTTEEGSLVLGASDLTWEGSKVWTQANDGANSGLDADLLDGFNSSQFMRADTNSFTTGNISLTGDTAAIFMDEPSDTEGLGIKRITCNDGGGNWNFRLGNYFNSGYKYTTTGDGAAFIALNGEGVNGEIILMAAPVGTANAGVGWDTKLSINTSGVYVNDFVVWNAGNDGANSGLDADLLDGKQLQSTGDNYDVIAYTSATGVTEVGKTLNFHSTASDSGVATIDTDVDSNILLNGGVAHSFGNFSGGIYGTTLEYGIVNNMFPPQQLKRIAGPIPTVKRDTFNNNDSVNYPGAVIVPSNVSHIRFVVQARIRLGSNLSPVYEHLSLSIEGVSGSESTLFTGIRGFVAPSYTSLIGVFMLTTPVIENIYDRYYVNIQQDNSVAGTADLLSMEFACDYMTH